MKKTILLLVVAGTAFMFAGCASTDTTKTAAAKTKETLTTTETAKKEEYVRYTPTGSWITRKEKKSDVEPTATETEETQRAFAELQRKGNKPERGPGG